MHTKLLITYGQTKANDEKKAEKRKRASYAHIKNPQHNIAIDTYNEILYIRKEQC